MIELTDDRDYERQEVYDVYFWANVFVESHHSDHKLPQVEPSEHDVEVEQDHVQHYQPLLNHIWSCT